MTYCPFVKGFEGAEYCEELPDIIFMSFVKVFSELGSDQITVTRCQINQITGAPTAESLPQG
jgi:hypothetical protein